MAGEKLALLGGPPAKATPYGTGKRFDERELNLLKETLAQETLFYTKGEMTNRMLDKFKEMTGGCFAVPVSSGTAGIHVALGAAGISHGDEVIIPPITDTGSAIGVLAQNAIPVFCDIDPDSYLMTPELVEEKITCHTKAVVVVHLTGNPCDMRGFVKLARKHRLILIEDCAQAWGATYHGKPLGTFGDFGCFSLNDFKHISCGDGGIVTTRYEYLYRTAHAFADKFYDRLGTGYRTPSAWLGFNYRITELQSAVALAQLEKLPTIINRRHELGMRLLDGIKGIQGVIPHKLTADSFPTFWFSGLRINEAEAKVSPEKFAEALAAEGVSTGQGYFSLLECDLFLKRQAYKNTEFPFDFPDGRRYFYEPSSCPNSAKFMRTFIRLNVNEFHTETDIDETIAAVKKVAAYYQEQS